MEELDSAFVAASKILTDAKVNLQRIRTEEDTKIQIITRILTECLGWNFSDIAAETAHENGYSDYLVSSHNKGSLLIEAKRAEGLVIGTSETTKMRTLKLLGPGLTKVMTGIDQAASYSLPNGLPISVLTDGIVWIVFKTFTPRENFKTKEAIVFTGFDALINDFSVFLELLSKAGFEKKPYNRIFDKIHEPRSCGQTGFPNQLMCDSRLLFKESYFVSRSFER